MPETEAEAFHRALIGGDAEPQNADPEPNADPVDDQWDPEKFDAESAKKLVAKLRDEVRAAKADKEPQSEKDARTIAALRKQWEEAAPKIKQYDSLAEASRTDLERAQDAQRAADARAAAATERVARAEVKAALAGLVDNPDSIIEDLNLSRFVNDDGDVNDDAIAALKGKYAAFSGRRAPRPDPTQASGSRGASAPDPAGELAAILQGQLNRQ